MSTGHMIDAVAPAPRRAPLKAAKLRGQLGTARVQDRQQVAVDVGLALLGESSGSPGCGPSGGPKAWLIELSIGDSDLARLATIARSRTEPASRVERARMLLA